MWWHVAATCRAMHQAAHKRPTDIEIHFCKEMEVGFSFVQWSGPGGSVPDLCS